MSDDDSSGGIAKRNRLQPPWFFCCGWWSPWCVLDEFAHRWLFKSPSVPRMPGPFGLICDRHEAAITRHFDKEDS